MLRAAALAALLVAAPALAVVGPLPSGLDVAWAAVAVREHHSGTAAADARTAVAAAGAAVFVGGWTSAGQGRALTLARFDLQGQAVWERTWTGAADARAQAVAVGGGRVYVAGAADGRLLLQAWDLDGSLQWSTTLGSGPRDEGRALALEDGAVYVAGYGTGAAGDADALAARFDAQGQLVWTVQLGGEHDQGFEALYRDAGRAPGDRLFAVGFWRHSPDPQIQDGYFAELTAGGGAAIQRLEGRAQQDVLTGVGPLEDEVVVVGARGLAGGRHEGWAMRFGVANAAPTWERTYGVEGGDTGFTHLAQANGRLYAAGFTTAGAGGRDARLAALDGVGIVLYDGTWGGAQDDAAGGLAVQGPDLWLAGQLAANGANPEAALVQLKECSPNGLQALPVDPDVAPVALGGCAAASPGIAALVLRQFV